MRLWLVDTETAEVLGGDRFRVPLSTAEREAMERQPPASDGAGVPRRETRSRVDDGLPQHDRVGDFELTLTRCNFIRHDGLFCHLEAENLQLGTRELVLLGTSSLLLDNQGARYSALGYLESDASDAVSFDDAPRIVVEIPARAMRSFDLIFQVGRREKKARLLELETSAGTARFDRPFFFDRDEI